MSIGMERGADALLQAAQESALGVIYGSDNQGDGESSLSEIEDDDDMHIEDPDVSDELSDPSGEENESEAETERLEASPHKFRKHQAVVLSSNNNGSYERSPSKLQNQTTIAELENNNDEEEHTSDEDTSANNLPNSPRFVQDEVEQLRATTPTQNHNALSEDKNLFVPRNFDTRKRKRSIFGGTGIEDLGEPARKRTGSIIIPNDDYAAGDGPNIDEEVEISRDMDGDISGDDDGDIHEGLDAEVEVAAKAGYDHATEVSDNRATSTRRGRQRRKSGANGLGKSDDEQGVTLDDEVLLNDDERAQNAEEDIIDNEGDDEAELALKNEEELERKRVALDQLSTIEKQFATFRERLFEERLDQLNREEAMLRQDKSTHQEYLAMMQCIEARKEDRVRLAERLLKYGKQSLSTHAIAKRSQILTQYKQEVRQIREDNLEQLGEQWYKIQHDRRSYAGSIPDYVLKFPASRSQQIRNQVAYTNEVSILAGFAKYVGFPAAPQMTPATAAEQDEDFEKMGHSKHISQPTPLPLHGLAALRTASSTSRFKPAEEQFIEQTPWANPQHPANAHFLQRQASAQQAARTSSPFPHVQVQPRRHSHQQSSGPMSGTFGNAAPSLLHHPNSMSGGGHISPQNGSTTAPLSGTVIQSPSVSRQISPSQQQSRPTSHIVDQHVINEVHKSQGNQTIPLGEVQDVPRDLPLEMRRDQTAAIMAQL